MAPSDLPPRPSLEYLKKLAKDRLREMRSADPRAKLADAQLAVARDHGFPSWRALKAEVERRGAGAVSAFFAACATGDLAAMREMLAADPDLVHARDPGDNALALHFAAGGAPLEVVRALLDAGSDVHGAGDAHALDVIGWAACFAQPRVDVVGLLLSRGAKHHVFSAVACGDLDALRGLAAEDPGALARRLGPSEQEQTALHYCVAPPDGLVGGLFRTGDHHRTLELLVELGADLEAKDARGRTPLELAMLRGDREAMRILHRAGARDSTQSQAPTDPAAAPIELAKSVAGLVPMLAVPDIDAAVAWYVGVGFELTGSNGEPGSLDWAEVAMGRARIMFASSGDAWRPGTAGVSLWLYTDRIDGLYRHLRSVQLEHSRAVLSSEEPRTPEIRFRADLYTTHYGMREFSVEDPWGTDLTFAQPSG